ncbi:hypothetical protein EAF04_003341 [Stromatinia cepivora]|nr:hypothetical protein EAF04_003341 [Stromatinia cepivora]
MAKWLNDGRTASALEHQFRPIKAAAKNASCNSPSSLSVALRAFSIKIYPYFISSYIPTAEKYGDGTTGKAISTRFERMRKESAWDLNSQPIGTNNPLGTTPKKSRAPRTPSKKTPKKAAASSNEEGDDDSDLEMGTPSKKSSPVKKEPMNKVKGGRVEKKNGTPSRAAKNTVKSYIDSDDEDDDDELIIKDEDTNAYDFGRAADGDEDMLGGGGFSGHGRGHGNGGIAEEENAFYDAES